MMAPGKDVPAAIALDDYEERRAAWEKWLPVYRDTVLLTVDRRKIEDLMADAYSGKASQARFFHEMCELLDFDPKDSDA